MTRYVGLDVHSKQSTFVIQDEAGQLVAEGSIPTTGEGFREFVERFQLEPGTLVGLESGTIAFFTAQRLMDLKLEVRVIDAREVRVKASRPLQKSDRRDAFEICDGLRRGIYRSIVSVPVSSLQTLRRTLSRRRHFVRTRATQVTAVKRLLREAGLGSLARSLQGRSSWTKLSETLSNEPQLRQFVALHEAMWICAQEQVATLEENIRRLALEWEAEIRRLMTAPGVGLIVATTTLAVLADARRFPSAKHVASYVGLTPSTFQSGDRDVHGRITKRGSSELRSMLCEAAHHAQRQSSPLNPYFRKIAARRGYRMAIVAVAHRLCRILYSMLRHGTDFDLQKAGVEQGRFEKTSVRRYRLANAPA